MKFIAKYKLLLKDNTASQQKWKITFSVELSGNALPRIGEKMPTIGVCDLSDNTRLNWDTHEDADLFSSRVTDVCHRVGRCLYLPGRMSDRIITPFVFVVVKDEFFPFSVAEKGNH